MLKLLTINNLAVVDHLQIEFGEGLNVLTGETGSGKSIIIDAVELLLGGRASQDAIRTGAERAGLEGVFDAAGNTPLQQLFADAGMEFDDGQVIVRREIANTGRGRIFVNNQASTAAFLRSIQPHLLDLHGQGDQQSLMLPSTQLLLLDSFAGCTQRTTDIEAIYLTLAGKLDELESRSTSEANRLLELETARSQMQEIETANIRPEEDIDLASERALLANAERLLRLCGDSYTQLYEDEQAVLSRLGAIGRHLDDLTSIDPRFQTHMEQLHAAKFTLEEIAFFLRGYLDDIQVSPDRLTEVESRLAYLERLKRKYGGSLANIEKTAQILALRIEELDGSEVALTRIGEALEELLVRYSASSEELSNSRRRSARDFEKRLGEEFSAVALEKSQFEVRFAPPDGCLQPERLHPWIRHKLPSEPVARHGAEAAQFYFSANPGEDMRPLGAVASGGELSRLMLVIKNIVAPATFPRTLIFDEIDQGIGGRVADAVGMRLKRLAGSNQVLCVTHQAQIARYADAHFLITKVVEGSRTMTRAVRLNQAGQVEELARMLAGADVTPLARKHARELLRSPSKREGGK